MRRQLLLVVLVGCGSSAKPTTAIKDREPDHATQTRERERAPVEDKRIADELPGPSNQCDNLSLSGISIDGMLDDWKSTRIVARMGAPSDGAIEVHCAWDGETLGLAFDIKDDRVIRVKGGHEDTVKVELRASNARNGVPVVVSPGNAMAKPRIQKPAKVSAADSLQPQGFSIEIAIPASAIPSYSESTPAFELEAQFFDADTATGAMDEPLRVVQKLELGDRRDLLDDFLTAVNLGKRDVRSDKLVDVDPDRKGSERVVVAGTVIGVLTDRYAYVTLPVDSVGAIKLVETKPFGARGQQIITALVHQEAAGGSRDLLMLWTVWSGQLQPLVDIEVRKQVAGAALSSSYEFIKGRKGWELQVTANPADGVTPDTWAEAPADDADSIVEPWNAKKGGVAYTLKGAEVERRDLPPRKKR